MKSEKSCGAILYKIINNKIFYYLEKSARYESEYGFAKGHIEENESETDTAIREIKEELNLDVIIDTNFRKVISYIVKGNINKDVVYFVSKVDDDSNIKTQLEEVSAVYLLPYEDAYKLLNKDNLKEVLKDANDYIKAKELTN